ncbi:MAG: hypothetical protein NZ551_01200 [Microscillaceae bacterium]|nr:hypothetical protein [Microscillaceae bacterium]MDW8459806.1 hypothetical protein [Cytophagales bacterium]
MQNEFYQDLIDAYLRNELPEAERIAFEQRLRNDSSLKAEFELQQEIVSGIQAYRKAQLKQRLEAIKIKTPHSFWTNLAEQPLRWAILIGGGIGLTIATTWYFASESKKKKLENPVVSKNTTLDSSKIQANIPKANVNIESPKKDTRITEPKPQVEEKTNSISKPSAILNIPKNTQTINVSISEHKAITSVQDTSKTRSSEPNENNVEKVPIINQDKSIESPKISTDTENTINPSEFLEQNPDKVLYRINYDNSDKKPNIERVKGKLVGLIRQYIVDDEYYWTYGGKYYHIDKSKKGFAEPTLVTDEKIIKKIQEFEKINK